MITSGKGQHLQLSHCLLLLCLSRCLHVVRFRPILCHYTMCPPPPGFLHLFLLTWLYALWLVFERFSPVMMPFVATAFASCMALLSLKLLPTQPPTPEFCQCPPGPFASWRCTAVPSVLSIQTPSRDPSSHPSPATLPSPGCPFATASHQVVLSRHYCITIPAAV